MCVGRGRSNKRPPTPVGHWVGGSRDLHGLSLPSRRGFVEYPTWRWCTPGGRVMLLESRSRTRDCERLSMYPRDRPFPPPGVRGRGEGNGPTAVHAPLTETCGRSYVLKGDVNAHASE
jgi:hypothetical protein